MKNLLCFTSFLLVFISQSVLSADALNNSRSPVLITEESQGGQKGVWVPNSYGGVTGVILDLEEVGSDNMLKTEWDSNGKFRPHLGKSYKLHSDKTIEDKKKGTKTRTVILISSERLEEYSYRNIICYKIHHQEDRKSDEGITLASKATHYSITLSAIKDDYEVLWLIPFKAI